MVIWKKLRPIPVLLLTVLLGLPTARAAERAPSRRHAIEVMHIQATGDGTASVVIKNTGDLPLRDVAIQWASTPPSKATFDPPRISVLGAGDIQLVSVRGIAQGRARVTAGDKAGWARSSRGLTKALRLRTALTLQLTAEAPRVVVIGEPTLIQFAVQRPATQGRGVTHPASNLVLSLLLPAGVRSADGNTHVPLALPEARNGQATSHQLAPVRVIAERSGAFRIRAVLRDKGGRAAAGAMLDCEARLTDPDRDRDAQEETREARPEQPGEPREDPYEESFGESEGLTDAPFHGPGEEPSAGSQSPLTPALAVHDALLWLAAHQSPDGRWEAAGFGRWCKGQAGKPAGRLKNDRGMAAYDPGVTGLALLAFFVAGYRDHGKNPFSKPIARGLRYLRNIQDEEGCFGSRKDPKYIYNHATASLAMVTAYDVTRHTIWKDSAQRALDFIALARNPYSAWRYGIKPGDNDTSISGWMMTTLARAEWVNIEARKQNKPAPLPLEEGVFAGYKDWLDKVTDPDYGRVGYVQRGTGPARPRELVKRFPGEKSEAMTAVGLLGRILMGEDPRTSKMIKLGVKLCTRLPPRWDPSDGSIDLIYWHYATVALHQIGGEPWQTWRKAMQTCALQSQRRDTEVCRYKGSWDPIDPWGPDGGRVYATAMMAICLQVTVR